jgi:uronate dehydrogenase
MSDILSKPVLLTGASGNIGRFLGKTLAEAGWTLRLSDVAPFPGPLPERATFTRVDLGQGLEVMRLAEGCGLILRYGGASHDLWPVEDILNGSLRGIYHIYEAARRERARVVFASSNHVTGFHERTTPLDSDCEMRPDSMYGVSKAYGELVAKLYWMKHRVESVVVRIGSCFPEPSTERMLSLWLSYQDLGRLMIKCGEAKTVGYKIIWGVSNNSRSFWRRDARAELGWTPQDSADVYADKLIGVVTGNPIAEKYQGGVDTSRG